MYIVRNTTHVRETCSHKHSVRVMYVRVYTSLVKSGRADDEVPARLCVILTGRLTLREGRTKILNHLPLLF